MELHTHINYSILFVLSFLHYIRFRIAKITNLNDTKKFEVSLTILNRSPFTFNTVTMVILICKRESDVHESAAFQKMDVSISSYKHTERINSREHKRSGYVHRVTKWTDNRANEKYEGEKMRIDVIQMRVKGHSLDVSV